MRALFWIIATSSQPYRILLAMSRSATPSLFRGLRAAALLAAVSLCAASEAAAQTPELVFTVPVPDSRPAEPLPRPFSAVEERGLALWSGAVSDFGVGATVSRRAWTVRSIASMTPAAFVTHDWPTLVQLEVIRPLLSIGSFSVAAAGGVRQERDGTRLVLGRVLAGANVTGGRMEGSLMLERAASSPVQHDAVDVVTSLGWSRRMNERFSVGVEGLGQDLEGFWNRDEADGGAKLLLGPSVHARSASGTWAASITAGPLLQTLSRGAADVAASTPTSTGRHLGLFVSASWVPSLPR